MPKAASVSRNKNAPPPEPPKKPLTAFFQFRKDVYNEVKEENPDLKITKITELIGERWRNLSTVEKTKYESQYTKEKKQYDKEKEKYEGKYGKIEAKPKKTRRVK